VRAYAAIFTARLKMLLQYRAAAWAGVGTQLFFGAALIAMRQAFYHSSATPPPLPEAQMITYSWLAQALFALSPFTANPDPEVRAMMRDGTVAYELARPLDLYTLWFVRNGANRLAPALLRCGPIFVLGMAFWGMQPPASLAAFVAFLLALTGAVALIAAWCTLITISLLWTISGDGISRIAPGLVAVLSGQILPLALMPDGLKPLLNFLPFTGMVDAPFGLWVGQRPVSELGAILLHQLAWTAVFVLVGRFLLAKGLKRLVVQGG
jgi:ABC-2 type transport system permease protein